MYYIQYIGGNRTYIVGIYSRVDTMGPISIRHVKGKLVLYMVSFICIYVHCVYCSVEYTRVYTRVHSVIISYSYPIAASSQQLYVSLT